jgi:hypothetical protein
MTPFVGSHPVPPLRGSHAGVIVAYPQWGVTQTSSIHSPGGASDESPGQRPGSPAIPHIPPQRGGGPPPTMTPFVGSHPVPPLRGSHAGIIVAYPQWGVTQTSSIHSPGGALDESPGRCPGLPATPRVPPRRSGGPPPTMTPFVGSHLVPPLRGGFVGGGFPGRCPGLSDSAPPGLPRRHHRCVTPKGRHANVINSQPRRGAR